MLFRSSPLFLILLIHFISFAQTPETVVASVDGVGITLRQVDETVASSIQPLQQQLYAIRKAALENLIATRILESEAKIRGMPVEELRRQLTAGEIQITRTQVEAAYAQNASFFALMSPDEARERLRLDLESQARMKYYRTGLEALRKKWKVTVNLASPPLDTQLDDGSSPSKGPPKAAVTIVEFSDFACPFCLKVQETLTGILKHYGDEVRLVFKHLPLEGHRNSLLAAQAAYCAAEQDRFWQFHDAVFASRNLSAGGLSEIATSLGLGSARFEECLSSERSRTAVVKDVELARRFNIDSTPSFLINGKLRKGALTFADFQSIIERELQQRSSVRTSSTN